MMIKRDSQEAAYAEAATIEMVSMAHQAKNVREARAKALSDKRNRSFYQKKYGEERELKRIRIEVKKHLSGITGLKSSERSTRTMEEFAESLVTNPRFCEFILEWSGDFRTTLEKEGEADFLPPMALWTKFEGAQLITASAGSTPG